MPWRSSPQSPSMNQSGGTWWWKKSRRQQDGVLREEKFTQKNLACSTGPILAFSISCTEWQIVGYNLCGNGRVFDGCWKHCSGRSRLSTPNVEGTLFSLPPNKDKLMNTKEGMPGTDLWAVWRSGTAKFGSEIKLLSPAASQWTTLWHQLTWFGPVYILAFSAYLGPPDIKATVKTIQPHFEGKVSYHLVTNVKSLVARENLFSCIEDSLATIFIWPCEYYLLLFVKNARES